jgi:hypothetical protein
MSDAAATTHLSLPSPARWGPSCDVDATDTSGGDSPNDITSSASGASVNGGGAAAATALPPAITFDRAGDWLVVAAGSRRAGVPPGCVLVAVAGRPVLRQAWGLSVKMLEDALSKVA